MTHDKLRPILDAYLYSHDYGKDSRDKATALSEDIRPLGATVNTKDALIALYAIISTSISLVEELENTQIPDIVEQDEIKEIDNVKL